MIYKFHVSFIYTYLRNNNIVLEEDTTSGLNSKVKHNGGKILTTKKIKSARLQISLEPELILQQNMHNVGNVSEGILIAKPLWPVSFIILFILEWICSDVLQVQLALNRLQIGDGRCF